jgi:hypothetical protein
LEVLADRIAREIERAEGEGRRVATAAFVDQSSTAGGQQLAAAVAELFDERLIKSGRVIVVESREIEAILQASEAQLSGAYDPTTVVSIGKLVGTEFLCITNSTISPRVGHTTSLSTASGAEAAWCCIPEGLRTGDTSGANRRR